MPPPLLVPGTTHISGNTLYLVRPTPAVTPGRIENTVRPTSIGHGDQPPTAVPVRRRGWGRGRRRFEAHANGFGQVGGTDSDADGFRGGRIQGGDGTRSDSGHGGQSRILRYRTERNTRVGRREKTTKGTGNLCYNPRVERAVREPKSACGRPVARSLVSLNGESRYRRVSGSEAGVRAAPSQCPHLRHRAPAKMVIMAGRRAGGQETLRGTSRRGEKREVG